MSTVKALVRIARTVIELEGRQGLTGFRIEQVVVRCEDLVSATYGDRLAAILEVCRLELPRKRLDATLAAVATAMKEG